MPLKKKGFESNEFGNFRQLIRLRYKQSYDRQNDDLFFDLPATNPDKKELWATEKDLKDVVKDVTPLAELQMGIYNNSYPHGWLIAEWFLKDIRINFDAAYRQNFFTYAHFHAYGGGAPSSLLYHADNADFENHLDDLGAADPLDPADFDGPYYMRRLTYYVMKMLSEISKNELKYLPSTHIVKIENYNLTPTIFFDDEEDIIYGYFTNMKNETQSYILNINNLADLFPGADAIGFGSATITDINAKRLYSNSGRSTLFNINTCYDSEFHPSELQGISDVAIPNVPEVTTGLLGGSMCITVPKYSIGYFKVNVFTSGREGLEALENIIEISPNPTGSSFKINNTVNVDEQDDYTVEIYTFSGIIKMVVNLQENELVDVSNLPSGIYLVKVTNVNNQNGCTTKKLIKIE